MQASGTYDPARLWVRCRSARSRLMRADALGRAIHHGCTKSARVCRSEKKCFFFYTPHGVFSLCYRNCIRYCYCIALLCIAMHCNAYMSIVVMCVFSLTLVRVFSLYIRIYLYTYPYLYSRAMPSNAELCRAMPGKCFAATLFCLSCCGAVWRFCPIFTRIVLIVY